MTAYEEDASTDHDQDRGHRTSQEEYVLYGTYEPLSVTITHILNNKSGISFTTYSHTGLPVAVFAMGAGQRPVQRLLRQHRHLQQAGRTHRRGLIACPAPAFVPSVDCSVTPQRQAPRGRIA